MEIQGDDPQTQPIFKISSPLLQSAHVHVQNTHTDTKYLNFRMQGLQKIIEKVFVQWACEKCAHCMECLCVARDKDSNFSCPLPLVPPGHVCGASLVEAHYVGLLFLDPNGT